MVEKSKSGFDPLHELFRWQRLFLLLGGLMAGILMWANSSTGLNERISTEALILTILSFIFPVYCILFYLLPLIPHAWERRKLIRLRRYALDGGHVPIKKLHPDTSLEPPSFPCSVQRTVKRSHVITIVVIFALAALVIVLVQLPLLFPDMTIFGNSRAVTPTMAIMIGILGSSILIGLLFTFMKSYYLMPQLEIDAYGITASYGRGSLHMEWSQLRYIALVNNSFITTRKAIPRRVIYEISDGENIICWAPDSIQTLSFHSSLSKEEYKLFLDQQLPAWIMQRTELPLLDMRLFKIDLLR